MPMNPNHYSIGIRRSIFLFLPIAFAFNFSHAQNAIVTENNIAGVSASQWDIPSNGNGTYGDKSIQGFATDISVNKGGTINFKITVTSGTNKQFGIRIYRIGYYQGNGARLMADLGTAFTGITQAACRFDNVTGLTDCGNWTTTTSWTVPSTAVSGIYVAKLTRSAAGGGGSSHIVFIVRDDASTSPLYFKTSDATWQAYNSYGGFSLYVGAGMPFNHGNKVSYNRPFLTRDGGGGGGSAEDWFMNAEYPMIRFLERNGYDISYTTDMDIARNATNLILNHKVFLSVGHDEYWSKPVRDAVEAARSSGKHLAFFSGNEIYWKTRWENSIDGANTPFRTMVCYKEGTLPTLGENPCGGKCDPTTEWTGLWRDGCSFPSGNACKPENALSGEISWDGATSTIVVPDTYKNLRFWRNTSVASLATGATATLTTGTLGYEWDWEQFQPNYPPGRITMSNTSFDGHVHKLSLYKSTFGGLVFGAGTVQWSWGLDATHDRANDPANPAMQQATINLFADMGVQPASIQAGLSLATASTDVTPPTVIISSPANNSTITSTAALTFSGTATDANTVAGVEISFDGGTTWSVANGTTNWSYQWAPGANGVYNVLVRGFDDSGNYPPWSSATKITITVSVNLGQNCPCNVFGAAAPTVVTENDNTGGIVVGMKFRAFANGSVTGIRFYKNSGVTGTHTGLLYNSTGTLLAQATFTGETATGWQQVNFSTPVAITGAQTYVAAFFSSSGYYSSTNSYFTQPINNGPLTALADGVDGPNGVYVYSNTPAFPTNSYQQSNYWVDLIYNNNITAVAGPNQTVSNPPTTSVTLDGSASLGAISSYAWTRISGPNTPTITTPNAATTTVTGLIVGTYVFQLSVNGGVSTSQVTILVNQGTVQANAGNNQTISLPTNSVLLNGSASQNATTYAWTQISGPNTATLISPSNVTCAANGLIAGTYVFQLAINGGGSANLLSQVTIIVNPAPPPTANAGANQIITLPVTSATLNGSGSTGIITSYSWTRISGPNTPTITTPAAATTTVTGLIQGTYVFQLSVNNGVSVSQTTVNVLPAVTTTNIFTTQTPAGGTQTDGRALELGVKFRSSVTGFVTGVRFYKTSGNSGTHTGELYSSTGTRLAQAVFSGETATGWQQVLFSSPVAITAGTTYIAAYHSSSGFYTSTLNYFASAVVHTPLTALASGTDGLNGLYIYSATPVFPVNSYQKSNYWVDVVFTSTPPAPVANAGANQTITLPISTVTLNGSGSSGTITSYAWTLVSGPNTPTITTPAAVSTTVTGLIQGSYIFNLSLNGGVSQSQVTITVNPAPPPTANAGANQTITLPISTVTLNGSGSSGTITSYAWTLVSGPNTPTITTPAAVSTTVTGLIQGSYVFNLSLNGGVSQSQVTITVSPAPPPTANAGANQTITLPTSTVTLNGSGSSGTITSYAWTLVSGPNTPVITTPAAVSTTVTGLIQGSYIFNLSLNGGVSQSQVTITVSPAPPPTANAGANQTISPPATSATLNGSASTGTITSYAWTLVSGPNTPTITTPAAVTTTVTGLIAGTYTFRLSLNNGASTAQTSVTLAASSNFTIFTGQTPAGGVETDGTAIELGVKFRSTVAGTITGIRFYKSSGNSGTHTGELYSSTGTRLAQAVFTNETATGWQQVLFSSPVAISAGTTYVAAYFSSAGFYTSTNNYFSTAVTDGPITALADGTDGRNGVYAYTAAPAFPSSSYLSSNYWVDVIFNGVYNPPSNTPPGIIVTSPAASATGISVNAKVYTFFTKPLNPASINANSVILNSGASAIPATVVYNSSDSSVGLTPASPLLYSTSYTVTIKGGASANAIKDFSGNSIAADTSWTFTTGPQPVVSVPANGPGGPILLISSSVNPFSRYPVEILRAEGWNAFNALDISSVTTTEINKYDVVIVGDMTLTVAQVTMLSNWVTAGGTLIAFHPDVQLASLLGIAPVGGTLSDKYLLVNTATGPGVGIVNQTIQYHGPADLYTVNQGTNILAFLYTDVATTSTFPAVTSRNVGTSGGQAIAFTYDLAKSVVYTRQGNPAWVGQNRDAQDAVIRADNLFFGNASFDPEPDWVNLDKVAIPQADEQQRLLTNIILAGNYDHKPLPRFWFLPKGKKAAVVMTGDDHAHGGTVGRFSQYLGLSSSNTPTAVANWDAIRGTSYIYPNTPISNAQIAAFQNQGFEISIHLNPNCSVWTPADLQNYFDTQLPMFTSQYYVAAPPATHRIHCLSWSDWATLPKYELQRGMRLNVSYYYWPPSWINNRPGMFTGSGMPMRFADVDGSLIDSYQVPSQMTDESGQTYPLNIDSLLLKATGPTGYFGVFCANMHTDLAASPGSDAIVQSALALQIPIVSSKQMLDWLDGRNSSTFSNYSWTNNKLSFTVSQDPRALNLKGMLPNAVSAGTFISLTLNGVPVNTSTDSIKGVRYIFFDALSGNYVATYGLTAPGNSGKPLIQITPTLDTTATTQWTNYLGQNYPNPFTQNTRINYGIAVTSHVELILYDMQGRPVKILVSGMKEAGNYSYDLNTGNLAKGMYFYKIRSGNFMDVKKLIIE